MPTTNDGGSGLLLDTHIWIWLFEGVEGKIAAGVRRRIQRAADRGRVGVSVMSVWEVGILASKGRVRLASEVADWVRRALADAGLALEPLTPEIAIESTRLPRGLPEDPADHILVATARLTGATLVTRDERILKYARAGHVSTLSARR